MMRRSSNGERNGQRTYDHENSNIDLLKINIDVVSYKTAVCFCFNEQDLFYLATRKVALVSR